MIISTRGKYAISVMVDLAMHGQGDEYISLKEITTRNDLPQKYVESIFAILSREHLIEASRGKNGGYRLSRSPSEYTLLDILSLTETSLSAVACHVTNGDPCPKSGECQMVSVWQQLDHMISDYLAQVSLTDLIQNTASDKQDTIQKENDDMTEPDNVPSVHRV